MAFNKSVWSVSLLLRSSYISGEKKEKKGRGSEIFTKGPSEGIQALHLFTYATKTRSVPRHESKLGIIAALPRKHQQISLTSRLESNAT